MKNRNHPSTIYTADVLENGVFGDSGEFQVTEQNKRDYWKNTLLPDVSAFCVHHHSVSDSAFSGRKGYESARCSWIECLALSYRCLALGTLSFRRPTDL